MPPRLSLMPLHPVEGVPNPVPPNTRAAWRQPHDRHKTRMVSDTIRHMFGAISTPQTDEMRQCHTGEYGFGSDELETAAEKWREPANLDPTVALNVLHLSTPRKEGLDLIEKGSWHDMKSGVVQELSNNVVDQFNVIFRLFHGAAANLRASHDIEIQQVLRKVTRDLREAFDVTNESFGFLLSTLKQLESVIEFERARVGALEDQLSHYEEAFAKQTKVIEEMRRTVSNKDNNGKNGMKTLVEEKIVLEKKLYESEKSHREEIRRLKDVIAKLQGRQKQESVCKILACVAHETGELASDSIDNEDSAYATAGNGAAVYAKAHPAEIGTYARKPIRNTNSAKIKNLKDKLSRCRNALGLSCTSLMLLQQFFSYLHCPECNQPLCDPKVTASGMTICAACVPKHFRVHGGNQKNIAQNRLVASFLTEFRKSLPTDVTQLASDIRILQNEL